MKKVLISNNDPGRVMEVAEVGQEFEVHPDFQWIDCDNDAVTSEWIWEEVNGVYSFREFDIIVDTDFDVEGYKYARMIGYKDIGEQLDMIYKELMANGTLSADGAWAQHITAVKSAIPKDDPQAVIDWYASQAPSE